MTELKLMLSSITVRTQLHLFEVVFDSARLLALAAEFNPYVLLTDLVEYEVPPLADDDKELTTLQVSYTLGH